MTVLFRVGWLGGYLWADGCVEVETPPGPGLYMPFTSHKTFSCIDLVFAVGPVLLRVTDIKILPRGVSNHAPLFLTLDLSVALTHRLWRLSRFWVSDTAVDAQFRTELTGYWAVNPGLADATIVFDAFKANTRLHYQTIIARIHKSVGQT